MRWAFRTPFAAAAAATGGRLGRPTSAAAAAAATMVLPVGCRALMNRQLFLLLVPRVCEASAELGPTPSSVLRHNILEEFSEVLLFLVLMIPRLESCGPALRAKFLTHLDRHFDYEATLEERRRGITGPPLYVNPLDYVRRGGLLPDYWRRTSRHVAVSRILCCVCRRRAR